MKVLLAHPGTQHSYQLAKQLYENGVLGSFHTCFAFGEDSLFYNFIKAILPKKYHFKLNVRVVRGVPNSKIRIHLLPLLKYLFQNKNKNSEQLILNRNQKFQRLISNLDIKNVDIVIGFDTSSSILINKAHNLGKKFVLDVSIGHPLEKEKIYKEIRKKYPLWLDKIKAKKEEFISLEIEEMMHSDNIVVPSNFVKQTYINNGIEENKIFVNPFGTNISDFSFEIKSPIKEVNFLFFGGLTARKGLPVLLEAWDNEIFDNHKLTIAGFGELPPNIVLPLNVMNLGKISKERRNELFKNADVFVFPSFFEGFAQVQIEAAVSGLPVIASNNSGCDVLIDSGINGFIIEPENIDTLITSMKYFIENKKLIPQMSLKIMEKGKMFTWAEYGNRWVKILNSI